MEYNDWYQRYQEYQPSGQNKPKKQKKGVSLTALVCCVLAAALVAGVAGGVMTGLYMKNNTSASASVPAATVQAVPERADSAATAVPEDTSAGGATVSAVQPGLGTAGTYTKAQIVEIAAPSVVGIDVTVPVSNSSGWGFGFGFGQDDSSTQEAAGAGSGVVITSDGYIVTCNHVIDTASTIKVTLNDERQFDATVVGTDERNDLAIIKIDATDLTPATLGDSDMLTVGDDVVAIGNHLGELRGTATGGMISALNRDLTVEGSAMTLLQTDAAVSPGSSGGGLFNSSGSLIGIVNAKATTAEAEGLGFAIPVNSVKQAIDDLIHYGYVKGRAYLGVYTQNVTLQSDRGGWGWGGYYTSGGASCVQVAQVINGGAAETAGIQANDLILAVGDTQITSNDVLSSAIGAYNAGDSATLTIQRDGQQMEITVTFGEYSPDPSQQ